MAAGESATVNIISLLREVLAIGRMRYDALFPYTLVTIVADQVELL
ncbi:hypothetical protein [Pseudomonas sp. PSKL.D1]|nr:hypothetical protein [Pseudomonas sp. PSKL.D1]WDY57187.1 hypothetical protein PVV54_21820 [Pseudomonas sp. PSKL.D1]